MTTDDELRRLAQSATPGRWSWDKVAREIRNEHGDDVVSAYPTHGIEPGDNGARIDIKYTDLEWILAAVNEAPRLLDRIAELERALRTIADGFEGSTDHAVHAGFYRGVAIEAIATSAAPTPTRAK